MIGHLGEYMAFWYLVFFVVAFLLFKKRNKKVRNLTSDFYPIPPADTQNSPLPAFPQAQKAKTKTSSVSIRTRWADFDFSKYPKSYVVVDLETTGLDVHYCEIIEIAALKVIDGKITEEFSSLIHPPREIPSNATSINHITNHMVKNAPTLDKVIPQFDAFVEGLPLIGHNSLRYDAIVLEENFFRRDFLCNYVWYDTYKFARQILEPPYKLVNIAKKLNVKQHGKAHRALADCYMTYGIYEKMREIAIESTENVKCIEKYTDKNTESTKLSETVFCLTGVPCCMPKSDFLKMLIANGATLSENVTLKTNYLIDCSGCETKKIKTARKYVNRTGIQIISEQQILEMLKEG